MDGDWQGERFEVARIRLRTVAYRLLGSASEADNGVKEGWLRLSRADTSEVAHLSGWLTSGVARAARDTVSRNA